MKPFLLCLVLVMSLFAPAMAAPKDLDNGKGIAPALTSATWRYDQDNVKDRRIRFRADGNVEATTWKGLWKITAPRTVEITLRDKRKAVLVFNEDLSGFTGTGFDKMEMRGKRIGDVPPSLR